MSAIAKINNPVDNKIDKKGKKPRKRFKVNQPSISLYFLDNHSILTHSNTSEQENNTKFSRICHSNYVTYKLSRLHSYFNFFFLIFFDAPTAY